MSAQLNSPLNYPRIIAILQPLSQDGDPAHAEECHQGGERPFNESPRYGGLQEEPENIASRKWLFAGYR
jgi:hypothetical protein